MSKLDARGHYARSQTAVADSKAQVLASGLVPTIAASVAAGAFAGIDGTAALTGWAAAGLAFVAVAFLGLVLWPRTGNSFRTLNAPELINAARTLTEEEEIERLAAEAVLVNRIAAVKFRWLRTAMALTGAAGLLAFITVVLAVTA
ncbi:Pycsar system effector family protein [Glycomyces albidus]|uniref:Pycsar effector protein domain-containing protein n=1 Tax=Glycomyces albidus TaxID=2656774 RepID=A0A6L5GH40_9ACTN|nr:Pycsar system effector family protein [Glycomyces albidus]MQM28703.1 hypothetical protein [Glycomyces albidus]